MIPRDHPAYLNASPDLEGFSDWIDGLRRTLPPEMRFAGLTLEARLIGLTLEERLDGLTSEERLVGLTEFDRILLLPDAALRALAPAYVATLSDDVQARICARLGR
jgi:hypothetical protein